MKEHQKPENQDEEIKFDEDLLEENSEIVGICSVKYFDLKQNRVSNYKFDYDTILDPKGDTGCYLLYMYARIQSIFIKGGYSKEDVQKLALTERIHITSPQE